MTARRTVPSAITMVWPGAMFRNAPGGGKGTTPSLLHALLVTDSAHRVFSGGNIGHPPIDFLDELRVGDRVVLELSSFQLQDLDISPHIAVVLSVTEDHLDYHADRAEYVAAKQG